MNKKELQRASRGVNKALATMDDGSIKDMVQKAYLYGFLDGRKSQREEDSK